MTTAKTIALTRRTFVGKVMSLLFNMLSRLVIAQEILLNTLWWPKWEGSPWKRRYMYTCGWFTLLYSRIKCNTVKTKGSWLGRDKILSIFTYQPMTYKCINPFLNWYCPNEGQSNRSSIFWVCSILIHSCYGLRSPFKWDGRENGENIRWVQHSWRIDFFELWCWRRFLRVPWTTRR